MNNENRHTLRERILAVRDKLSSHDCEEKSLSISSRFLNLHEATDARVVFIYMHFRSEVPTHAIISQMLAEGKTVTIPKTISEQSRLIAVKITDPEHQVSPGYCGIPEPSAGLVDIGACNPKSIDIVIIPGSVFDKEGGRMGYGGGYYDRFLANEAPDSIRVGLAFELQIVERVPLEPHDQLMDYVVTEENIYDCRRNRYA